MSQNPYDCSKRPTSGYDIHRASTEHRIKLLESQVKLLEERIIILENKLDERPSDEFNSSHH